MRGRHVVVGALLGLLLAGPTCSTQNQEGPDVTCADLECGRVNACAESIIAQCLDGKAVKFHVCGSNKDDVCKASWQVPGQFKCDQFATDCEGCRPERAGCEAADAGAD